MSTYDPNRTVVVATGNAHKLAEIEAILGAASAMEGVEFVALGDLGDFPEPVEDGSTFFDNALIKARDALDQTGIGMDSRAGHGADGIRLRMRGAADCASA
jgi:XTP/dITP diphosphohydrolase